MQVGGEGARAVTVVTSAASAASACRQARARGVSASASARPAHAAVANATADSSIAVTAGTLSSWLTWRAARVPVGIHAGSLARARGCRRGSKSGAAGTGSLGRSPGRHPGTLHLYTRRALAGPGLLSYARADHHASAATSPQGTPAPFV